MSELKLPAASGGGSISIKGPASSGSDTDLLDTSGNLNITGQLTCGSHLNLGDGDEIKVGAGEDLLIYHTSDQNYLKSNNGRINLRASEVRCEKADGSEVLAKFIADGACELRYNDSAKLTTIDTGVNITGGIRLGGNNAVNELDDYEEGTWTPDLSGWNALSFNSRSGRYTKVGRFVYCSAHINIGSSTAGGGHMKITGLPFTCADVNPTGGGVVHYTSAAIVDDDYDMPHIHVSNNQTEAPFYKNGSTYATNNMHTSSSVSMLISLHYEVA